MAFTAEQKEAIKKRAQLLYGNPLEVDGKPAPDAGKYLLQATKELFTPEQLSQIGSKKEKDPQLTIEQKIREQDLALRKEEEAYATERARQLEAEGVERTRAEDVAKRELEGVRTPVPLGYGTAEERAEGGLSPVIEALLPSARRATPIGKTQQLPPSGIQYAPIQDLFEKQFGIEKDRAREQVEAFRLNIIEPRRAGLIAKGVSQEEADRQALKESFDVLADINKRITDKSSYLQPEALGSGDPWIRAFEPRIARGEGVPDLTEEQRAYLSDTIKLDQNKKIKERSGETKQVIKLQNGAEIAYDTANPPQQLPPGATIVSVPKTREELVAEIEKEESTPWWLTDKADAIKRNPEAFEESGIFETTTPYGTKKENLGSYILRSALTIPNAFAGTIMSLGYDVAGQGDLPESRAQIRKEKGYEDRPILLNIAEGRGFFGEAKEAAEITELEGLPYYATLSAGFAADLLDPSLDIVKGVTTGVKTAAQATRAASKIYGADALKLTKSAIAKDALKAGANEFLDSHIIGNFTNRRFEAGDFRNLMTRQVTGDLETQAKLLQSGGDARQAFNALPDNLKQSVYGKRFNAAIQGGEDVSAVAARLPIDETLVEATKIIDDLNAAGRGADVFKAVRRKDVARSLGALASIDEGVKAVIEPIFRSDITALSGTKLNKAIQALAAEPEQFEKLQKIILADVAAKKVFDATKDIGGLGYNNLVFVTKNTLTDKVTAKSILERVKTSEIGKLGESLSSAKVAPIVAVRTEIPQRGAVEGIRLVGKESAPRILPAYKISDEQADIVENILSDLQRFNKMDAVTAKFIRERLANGDLLVEDFRKLLDANIDMVAEGIGSTTGKSITRARDLARLPVSEQVGLLMPVEQRSLSKDTFRKIYEKLTGRKSAKANLSVGQRQLINDVRNKISSLDVGLRESIRKLKNDEQFRALYDVRSNENLTIPEMMSLLIVGPNSARLSIGHLTSQIDGIIDDLFFSKSTKEDILDLFTGTSVSSQKSILTGHSKQLLAGDVQQAVLNIMIEPRKFFEYIQPVIRKAQRLATSGDPTLVRNPDDVIDLVAKNGGKIAPEVQLGAYYRSEAQKIADEALGQLINTEIGKNNIDLFAQLDPEFQSRIAETIQRASGRNPPYTANIPQDIQNKIILNRAKRILKGDRGILTQDDIAEVLGPSASSMGGRALRNDYQIINEIGEDVAEGILKRTGIRGSEDPVAEIEKLIGELNDPTTSAYKQFDLLFGEDVATQLKTELASGFNENRQALLQALEQDKKVKYALGFLDKFKSFQYLAMLNLRPRFHGANLLTGADIYYSTTGRMPRIDDMVESIKVLTNRNPYEIIEVGGRQFTVGELNEILTTQTGKTATRSEIPSGIQADLVKLIEKGGESAGRKVWRAFQELPQNEDLIYRYAALKDTLRQGRSLDEAIAVARRSMFDPADITDKEAAFKKLVMFYGFQRNNLANAIRNLTNIAGIKRIGRASRVRNNLTDMLLGEGSEEIREYSPSSAQTRIIFSKIGFDPERGREIIQVGPPLASLDAIYSLADVLKGQPQGLFGGSLKSSYKSLLGVEDKFKIDPDKIPDEHVQLLKAFAPEGDPLDAINMILVGMGAEPTTYVPETAPGRGVEIGSKSGRFIIPLLTDKQKSKYKIFMTGLAATGLATATTDWSRSLSPSGKLAIAQEQDPLTVPKFMFAFQTPQVYISPEQQAYNDRIDRLKQLKGLTATLKRDEIKRMEAEKPGSTEKPAGKPTRQGVIKDILKDKEKVQTLSLPQLEAELKDKKSERTGYILKLRSRRPLTREEKDRKELLEKEIPSLEKQIEAAKAAKSE